MTCEGFVPGIGETGWFRLQYWYWIRIFDFEHWFWYWLWLWWSIGVGLDIDSNTHQVLILISSWFRFRSWSSWIPWQESNRALRNHEYNSLFSLIGLNPETQKCLFSFQFSLLLSWKLRDCSHCDWLANYRNTKLYFWLH